MDHRKNQPVFRLPPSAHTSLSKMPEFVEHGGETCCRHPADALDSRMYGFVVGADRVLLDRWCDRMFNVPSGGTEQWRAAGDDVLVNFVDIPTMGSTDLLDRQLGVCAEREAAIWFPIYDTKNHRFAWAVPYMFVDSGLALTGGREVYGFPKQMGTFELPRDDQVPSRLSVATDTLARHAPSSTVQQYTVVSAERSGPSTALGTSWLSSGDAAEQLASTGAQTLGASGLISPAVLFFGQLVEENLPMLLLKQFRDAHQQGAACYQAIVSVDMSVLQYRRGGMLPSDYQLTVADLDGEPLLRELGLAPVSTPKVAFWLDFDFVVRLGDIIWEWPRGRR